MLGFKNEGKNEVVRFLLKSGANPHTVNNLGKTASSMAAFVGKSSMEYVLCIGYKITSLQRTD